MDSFNVKYNKFKYDKLIIIFWTKYVSVGLWADCMDTKTESCYVDREHMLTGNM